VHFLDLVANHLLILALVTRDLPSRLLSAQNQLGAQWHTVRKRKAHSHVARLEVSDASRTRTNLGIFIFALRRTSAKFEVMLPVGFGVLVGLLLPLRLVVHDVHGRVRTILVPLHRRLWHLFHHWYIGLMSQNPIRIT
jgi:hypothetical protein